MNNGIRRKLLVSFLAIAFVSLLTVNLLVNIAISITFYNYIDEQQNAEAQMIVKDLTDTYSETGHWPEATLMDITHQALTNHMILKIFNQKNQLVWDSNQMIRNSSRPDSSIFHSQNDEIATKQFPILKNGAKIGALEIQFSKDLYQEQEGVFLTRFNILSWISLAIVLLAVYFFSASIARGISAPLIEIKKVAIRLRDGDLNQRVPILTRDDEVAQVGQSINHLADTLEQQQQLRKFLTADIAHELRTPLATMRSYLEAFQDGIWEPTDEKLQICYDQVMQLVNLIQDLEHLADVENPMLKLKKEEIDSVILLEDAIRSVAKNWDYKQIELQFIYREGDEDNEHAACIVNGDYYRLLQVFINLLNNAYKFTPEAGRITVEIQKMQRNILIHIGDTGCGIDPLEQAKIFERFYRGEKSRNRKTGGAGLGLAIVKAIVEAHGGTVTVSSVVDQGTTFTVCLPKG
ncbi:ATP-binding protein [Fodinisporobacter ferrooxydans]|uniref:histidine kinase n=1 Tax=Fodinisporobacter ferrooxydans TaxID=2901836 RepID=A0ABY4CQ02_9BACL|nr:ATP-binding protein [Alicyclobacillaceae bacterium MYW30-H2]